MCVYLCIYTYIERITIYVCVCDMGFPGASDGKESTCNAGDPSSIPGSGRSPGEGVRVPAQLMRVLGTTWLPGLDTHPEKFRCVR